MSDTINYWNLIIPIIVAILSFPAIKIISNRFSRNKRNINQRYLMRFLQLVIIGICLCEIIEVFDPGTDLKKLVVRGSALIVAILGFAAQTALSDIICGLLISFSKPFEIGDRIIIEGNEPGVVEDITLRHTVVCLYDGITLLVPNSQLNSKVIMNTSKHDRRGIHLKYSVSYDTDVHRAMDIIRDCVVSSPYTLNVVTNGITEDSGPVYFLTFADSALILETTIWVSRFTSSYTAITDMNLRVNKAFKEYGIEIPYNYMNVVRFEGEKTEAKNDLPIRQHDAPSKRHYRTDTVKIRDMGRDLKEAVEIARTFAKRQRLKERDAKQLELMTEESIGVIGSIMDDTVYTFWIEGSGLIYRIHIVFNTQVGGKEYLRFMNLSTTGKNEADTGLPGKLLGIMVKGFGDMSDSSKGKSGYEWSIKSENLSEEEIGESILTALASDIKVSVTKEKVELIVVKKG